MRRTQVRRSERIRRSNEELRRKRRIRGSAWAHVTEVALPAALLGTSGGAVISTEALGPYMKVMAIRGGGTNVQGTVRFIGKN